MATTKEHDLISKIIRAQDEVLPNLVVPLQPDPHMPGDEEESPKPSERWKQIVKKKREEDLQEGPLNEAAGGFPEKRMQFSETDKKEWEDWLSTVTSGKKQQKARILKFLKNEPRMIRDFVLKREDLYHETVAEMDEEAMEKYMVVKENLKENFEEETNNTVDYFYNMFKEADPTGKSYVDQIITWWTNYSFNERNAKEDMGQVKSLLDIFHRNKENLPNNNIATYRSMKELYDVVKTVMPEAIASEEAEMVAKQEIDGDKYELYNLKTKDAAMEMCKGTTWCIKDPNARHYEGYKEKGNVYTIWKNDKPFIGVANSMPNANGGGFVYADNESVSKEDRVLLKDLIEVFVSDWEDLETPEGVYNLAKFSAGDLNEEQENILLKDLAYATDYAVFIKKDRWEKGEPLMASSPRTAHSYAMNALKGRFPEGEPAIAEDGKYAMLYAKNVIKDRWTEGEPAIAENGEYAYRYSAEVVRGRWPEGEAAIGQDAWTAMDYAEKVIEGRFPEGEAAIIAKSSEQTYHYAKNVLKGERVPEIETALAQDREWGQYAYHYANTVLEDRFPEGEATIAKYPAYAGYYAKNVIKGPWPEGEPAIASHFASAGEYARDVLKGPFPEGEAEIAKYPAWSINYAIQVLKGRFPEGEAEIAKSPLETASYFTNILEPQGLTWEMIKGQEQPQQPAIEEQPAIPQQVQQQPPEDELMIEAKKKVKAAVPSDIQLDEASLYWSPEDDEEWKKWISLYQK